MSKLRVQSFSISIDGFGAGPNQSLDSPLGVGGMALHDWAFTTRTFRQMFGDRGGVTGVDDDFAARGFRKIGAWIMAQHVRTHSWAVARRDVERMVGDDPAIPHARFRA
jgi:hypothetical protein